MVISNLDIYRGKRVFLTGHTGFKGSWMTVMLHVLGCEVYGYSLDPRSNEIFELIQGENLCRHQVNDIKNIHLFKKAIAEAKPDIIFHMAAQPLVLASYKDPVETIATNYNGTFNLLEIIRTLGLRAPVVVVTTDKVYRNEEAETPFREDDPLGGKDIYSGSKAAVEILTSSYASSFDIPAVTARAGNVIGGGDFSENRIVPDIIRAYLNKEQLVVRNPNSVRPWQHVMESISGYLAYAHALLSGSPVPQAINFGPSEQDYATVEELLNEFNEHFPERKVEMVLDDKKHPSEAGFLTLDSQLAKSSLGWVPKWNIQEAVKHSVEWYLCPDEEKFTITKKQVESYLNTH